MGNHLASLIVNYIRFYFRWRNAFLHAHHHIVIKVKWHEIMGAALPPLWRTSELSFPSILFPMCCWASIIMPCKPENDCDVPVSQSKHYVCAWDVQRFHAKEPAVWVLITNVLAQR